MRKFAIFLVLTVSLVGCLKTNPDPARGGLINGLKGLQGGYDDRIEDLREELAAEEAALNN